MVTIDANYYIGNLDEDINLDEEDIEIEKLISDGLEKPPKKQKQEKQEKQQAEKQEKEKEDKEEKKEKQSEKQDKEQTGEKKKKKVGRGGRTPLKEKRETDDYINQIVEEVIRQLKPVTIKGEREELYFFYRGYYHRDAVSDLKGICNRFFRSIERKDLIHPAIFSTILHKIKSHRLLTAEQFREPPDKINLKSGVLDIYTRAIEPHVIYNKEKKPVMNNTHAYNFLYKLDNDYNPSANCPKIMGFLTDLADGDMNKYLCLIEFFGFMLISSYLNIKKYMLLAGRGDNGKSTLEQLLNIFLTKGNVVNLSIQQICDKDFMAYKLHGKKLNIRGEMSQLRINSLDKLKSFTGSDRVTVDRKYRDPVDIENTCKFLFHFNDLPSLDLKRMDEQSWKRMLLLKLTKRFQGQNDNKNLIYELTTTSELEGFLNLCLDGLMRLMRNKRFTYNDEFTFEDWIEYMENELDTFIGEYLVIGENYSGIPTEELYKKFKIVNSWNGNVPMSKTKFSQLITKHPIVEIKRRGKPKEQTKCYINISYRTQEDTGKICIDEDIKAHYLNLLERNINNLEDDKAKGYQDLDF